MKIKTNVRAGILLRNGERTDPPPVGRCVGV